MKRLIALVLVLAVLGVGAYFVAVLFGPDIGTGSASFEFEPERPNVAAISSLTNFTAPANEADAITKALELYNQANLLDQKAAGRFLYSFCPTENVAAGMNNKIDLYRFELKDADEYFRIDYRVENSVPLFKINDGVKAAANKQLELVVTERSYYKTGMSDLKYEKVRDAQLIDGNKLQADWTLDINEQNKAIPYFNANQELKYEKSEHIANANTVKTATVTKNADGTITVRMELNTEVEETTRVTAVYIRDGSGDPKANYDEIIFEFTVWDNGYYKSFDIDEKWSGKAMGFVAVKSSFAYRDLYSYDSAKYTISQFADAAEIRAKYN